MRSNSPFGVTCGADKRQDVVGAVGRPGTPGGAMERGGARRPARWWSLAPFGRLGRLLGFRWVFPFGTLPIPFHPLFLPGVLIALLAWLWWRVVGLVVGASDQGAWGSALALLGGAAAVGVCLSVPILAWVVLVLGGRLVQAALVLSAMVLLTVSAATGREAAWAAVPPAVFVAVWAVQAARGRVVRGRLRTAVAGFAPVPAQGRAVVLDWSVPSPHWLIERAGAIGSPGVWVQGSRDSEMPTAHFRVDPELAAFIRVAARDELPEGVLLRKRGDVFHLQCPAPLPDDGIRVEAERADLSSDFVRGELRRVTFQDTSEARSVVTGTASVVALVPLMQCFHWVSLTSRSEWVVGFAHGRAEKLGPGEDALHSLFAPGSADPLGTAAMDGVLLPLREAIEERDAAIERLRVAALSGPIDLVVHGRTIELLISRGRALLGDDAAAFLTAWLQVATRGRQPGVPSKIADLVAKLSDEEICAHADRFMRAFNSRTLALQWTLTPDLDTTPLPRDLYRFGDKAGFGLIFSHPDLYVRLGDLLPPFRKLLANVNHEMALPDVVREALVRWDVESLP